MRIPNLERQMHMAKTTNGQQDHRPPHGVRFDDLLSTAVPSTPHASAVAEPHASGRKFVLLAVVAILVLWGSLYLLFRDWRARYQARASFGATQVAPVIDSIREMVPYGVDAQVWRDAVRETHEMLTAVTGSNLLSLAQMKSLREELEQIVSRVRAHPETAREELAGVWNNMADRAEFVLKDGGSGHRKERPRPAILPPRPETKGPKTGSLHGSGAENGSGVR